MVVHAISVGFAGLIGICAGLYLLGRLWWLGYHRFGKYGGYSMFEKSGPQDRVDHALCMILGLVPVTIVATLGFISLLIGCLLLHIPVPG